MSAPASDSSGGDATQQHSSSLIARQPLTDPGQAVVAYELLDRSTAPNRYDTASDIFLVFNALNHAGNELPLGKVMMFINRTHQSLLDVPFDLVQPEMVALNIAPVPGHDPDRIELLARTILQLKEQGYRIAFDHTVVAPAYSSWQPLADYVKLDLQVIKAEQVAHFVHAVTARTKAKTIAHKVESREQFDMMKGLGASLFQGYWVAAPDVVRTNVVVPQLANVLQLMNLVRSEADTLEIEAVLKRDAMLGFKLLRVINSAGFGLKNQVTSFRQAVMLMGMKKLFRWTALLLTISRENGSPAVVGTTAVVRARMMELLGVKTLSPEELDDAFVVGLFSLIDSMLGVPMEQALGLLSLPDAVTAALLRREGQLGSMLQLTIASESGDEEAFATAATALDYSNHHINMAQMEALIWADSLAV